MVRNDRRNCTEGRPKYSPLNLRNEPARQIRICRGISHLGGVTSGSVPVLAQVPELAQQNLTSAIRLRLDPDTKPLLERDESCLPDIYSAHFEVRFEVPLEFHVCLPRRPEKMC
jgi:hypothetical protein